MIRPTTTPPASTSKSSSLHSPDGREAHARLRIRVTAASLRGQGPTIYLSLYFLTQFLKLYAIRFQQQRFSILSYARNPCPEAVWIKLESHFSDFEVVIWFWHG